MFANQDHRKGGGYAVEVSHLKSANKICSNGGAEGRTEMTYLPSSADLRVNFANSHAFARRCARFSSGPSSPPLACNYQRVSGCVSRPLGALTCVL